MTEDKIIDHAEQVLLGIWNAPDWFFERSGELVYRTMILKEWARLRFDAPRQLFMKKNKKVGMDKEYILIERKAHDDTTTTNI